jgi:DprA/Smf-like nucleotide binding protein involved in DNA uptake
LYRAARFAMLPPVKGLGGSVSDGVKLSDEQRLDWLRLIRSDNVGPRGILAQTPQEL